MWAIILSLIGLLALGVVGVIIWAVMTDEKEDASKASSPKASSPKASGPKASSPEASSSAKASDVFDHMTKEWGSCVIHSDHSLYCREGNDDYYVNTGLTSAWRIGSMEEPRRVCVQLNDGSSVCNEDWASGDWVEFIPDREAMPSTGEINVTEQSDPVPSDNPLEVVEVPMETEPVEEVPMETEPVEVPMETEPHLPITPLTNEEQCGEWADNYGVKPGFGWGTAPTNIQNEWDSKRCNTNVCPYWKSKHRVDASSWGSFPESLKQSYAKICTPIPIEPAPPPPPLLSIAPPPPPLLSIAPPPVAINADCVLGDVVWDCNTDNGVRRCNGTRTVITPAKGAGQCVNPVQYTETRKKK